MNITFKFSFGDKVKDTITGFQGTIVSAYAYNDGSKSYSIQPKVGDDGKMPKSEWIEESRLEVVE